MCRVGEHELWCGDVRFPRSLAGSWIDRMITKLLHAPLLEQIETAMAEWEATQVRRRVSHMVAVWSRAAAGRAGRARHVCC